MVARSADEPQIKWLMDLHGLVDALSSGKNAIATLADAIKSGELKVIGPAGPELQNAFPELWDDFAEMRTRKYAKPQKADHELAAHLQQMYKAPILGGIPSYDQFLAMAMCARFKCRLITSGKAFKRSLDICKNASIAKDTVATLADL